MVNLALPKPDRSVLLKDNFSPMLITDITKVAGKREGLGIFNCYRTGLKRRVKRYWPGLRAV